MVWCIVYSIGYSIYILYIYIIFLSLRDPRRPTRVAGLWVVDAFGVFLYFNSKVRFPQKERTRIWDSAWSILFSCLLIFLELPFSFRSIMYVVCFDVRRLDAVWCRFYDIRRLYAVWCLLYHTRYWTFRTVTFSEDSEQIASFEKGVN